MSEFTVYGRPGCGYCVRAVQLLEARNLPLRYIDIWAENISKADLSKLVGEVVTTVPVVLRGNDYIGGCTDLEQWLRSQPTA